MRSGCITSFLDKLRLTGTCFTMGLPCFLAVLYVILMYSWHLVACGLPSNQSFLWRRKRTNICNFCTNPVLEGLLAFKALQPHPNLSIVACSVHKHCLNLSHDDILLGKQKSQEAGDDEAVANSGGPADPIHLRLSMRAHGVSDFGGPTGASMISTDLFRKNRAVCLDDWFKKLGSKPTELRRTVRVEKVGGRQTPSMVCLRKCKPSRCTKNCSEVNRMMLHETLQGSHI